MDRTSKQGATVTKLTPMTLLYTHTTTLTKCEMSMGGKTWLKLHTQAVLRVRLVPTASEHAEPWVH